MTITLDPGQAPAGPAEVYAALRLGALLVASGTVRDPFPPEIEELWTLQAHRSYVIGSASA